MLTVLRKTAIGWGVSLILAVFFSPAGQAQENRLFTIENDLNDLIYILSRSVVTIEASRRVPANQISSNNCDEALESVVSSGIICDSLGRVIAAASAVVGKDRILVAIDNQVCRARLVAVDYQTELALLECPNMRGQPARFSTRQACAGQMIVALGNAYGVRAAPSLGFCAGVREDGMMQFSVPVTSGAIGGGVFDLSGNLLGLITGGLGEETRVTVALPAYQLPGILDYLLTKGDRESGFVGITSRDIEVQPGIEIRYPQSLAAVGDIGATEVVERGVLITTILPLSPAQRAGLRVGDLVYLYDQVPVNSAAGLARLVRQTPPGKRVDVHLLRNNAPYELTLTTGRKHLNLITGRASLQDNTDPDRRVIDSLQQVITELKGDIQKIEERLRQFD